MIEFGSPPPPGSSLTAALETFQLQAVYGMFLSDLAHDTPFHDWVLAQKWPRRAVALSLTIIGLFIASYPGEHPEWSLWSDYLREFAYYIFPADVNIGKRYSALGLDMVILAIYLSPSTKEFLANRVLLWLGKQSFAVYLVHGTLVRTVLCWMLYGISGQPWAGEIVDEKGQPIYDDFGEPMHPHWIPIRAPWVVAISIPACIALVYVCATLWTTYVDPLCAKLTQKVEKAVFEDES